MTPLVPASDGPLEPDIARSTAGEKIALVLSILLPPVGLLGAIVAAVRSSRRRGWVVGVVKAALALGIVLSIVIGIGGYFGIRAYRQQQQHDQVAAASAQFCSTISADPTMIAEPDFGWPAVAASIPDTLAAMTAYEDKWTKLAQVSPDGVKADVLAIATAAKQIADSVSVARTVNDASNIAVMSSAAASSGVPAWYSEYCS